MFRLSEDSKKHKTKLLILSGISWFIVMTGVLPTKVALLGLDFSENNDVIGWFLAVLVGYFLLVFSTYSVLEIYHYLQPQRIVKGKKGITGNVLGLTEDEISRGFIDYSEEPPSERSEWDDIQKNKEIKERAIKQSDLKVSNRISIALEVFSPIVFGLSSLTVLLGFLIGLKSIT